MRRLFVLPVLVLGACTAEPRPPPIYLAPRYVSPPISYYTPTITTWPPARAAPKAPIVPAATPVQAAPVKLPPIMPPAVSPSCGGFWRLCHFF